MVRVMQRRYPTQRAVPLIDANIEFDLRTISGHSSPAYGPAIKGQSQWVNAAYEVLASKRSNIQFQVGVQFYYPKFEELADSNADQHFVNVFKALRSFASPVIDPSEPK